MFFKSARLNFIFSIVLVLAASVGSACSGGLGCDCASLPLPNGDLPHDQTVEGGAQIRITPAGMQKINTLVTSLVGDALGSGVCIPGGEIGNAHSTFGTGAYYCYQNDDACAPGCDVDIAFDALSFGAADATTLNLHTQFDVDADVPLDYQVIGIGGSCTMHVAADNLVIDANIALSIDEADGELGINLAGINTLDLNLDFSNCGLVSGLLDLIGDVLDFIEDYLGDFINPLIAPLLDDLIQGFLPDPLGIEGMIDLGDMLAGVSPGTEALLEGRIVPGGYVGLNGGGMTLGVITGINADEDPSSRGADVDSEPALCVPPFGPPNFAAPPANLPGTSRNTFTLAAAGAFSGQPDPANDLAMGVSETTLDLFGHHFVTSGGMCLGIGSSFAPTLNVSTIGILVPSLAELASNEGNDPLLLVTRPQKPLDFAIGDGSDDNPLLTVHIEQLEVDFYAFLYERFTRVFTLSLTLDAGINFTVDNSTSPPTLTPVLVGLSSDNIGIQVLNSEFVREAPADLEAVLPTVFDLALPMLADGIGPIEVPDLGTFSLTDITLGKVTTPQDDFLAINATLGVSSALRARAAADPHYAAAVAALDAQAPLVLASAPAAGTARLLDVHTPPPEAIRAALTAGHSPLAAIGQMPTVTIDTDAYDAFGRPLEWGYRLDGGLWRPFTTASPLVIEDRAFAWQGKYDIELRSRVVGDTRTESHDLISFPVIIDSVAPYVAETMADTGDAIAITAYDIVSKDELRYAFAEPGADAPTTAWQQDNTLARSIADGLIHDGKLGVFVKDEAGNQTDLVVYFHGQAGTSGCDCAATGGGPSTGGLLLVLLVGGALVLRRRDLRRLTAVAIRVAPTVGLWLGISVVVSLAPGCSCSHQPGTQACEDVADCEGFCDGGDIPFCIDGTCVCSDDIPPGRIGPYSDVVSVPDGSAWVSAYASSHGDLVVAHVVADGRIADVTWQWVDGVPDGPVEIPGAMIRGGISAPGPDVGMYTSIAVGADGSPMVSYFDHDTGSLMFAQLVAGVWQKHVVEAGAGTIEGDGGTVAGMYTSLSARSDDGRPGVAYLRHVNTGGTVHAEVRWASSQSATPSTAADWTFWTVDTADVPAEDPENPDVFPLPGGLGLFVDAARGPDQAPVVAYYDRGAGDLKLARFNVTGGTFDAPVVLDGASSDAGWSPTVGVDAAGVVHIAYVGATYDDLQYIRSDAPSEIEIIDNGYRIVGTTDDGLPKPEFHLVGDDATMVMASGGPTVVYQDATTHELLLAQRHDGTGWAHLTIAGAEDPFVGAYGFFASGANADTSIVMSTWVLDQPNQDQWVQVFHTQSVVE